MKIRGFFVQGFIYLCLLFLLIYGITNWGHNFSVSLFLAQLLGVLMLASLVFLCSKMSILGVVLFSAFLIASTLCFAIDLICSVIFDTPLTSAMIFTALETNLGETLSFIFMYGDKIAIALGFFGLLLLMFFSYRRWIAPRWNQASPKVLSIFAFLGFPILAYQIYLLSNKADCRFNHVLSFALPFRYGCEFYGAIAEISNAKKAFSKDQLALTESVFTPPPNSLEAIKNIVLIIGESTQRGAMQIYGASKPTTPRLLEMQKKGNVLVFSDVISPHAQTTLSLRKVLTFSNFENQAIPWYQQNNLVSIFKKSGYPVYWISNQLDIESKYSSSTSIIASLSDVSIFVSRFKRHFDEVFYDEKIFPELDAILQKRPEKGFFILHLMGTHGSYGKRYPSEFSKFSDLSMDVPTRMRARYLNAVFYNDYIVSEIFKRFAGEDSIVIYLSDHGEEVYDFRDFIGHSDDKISRFMVEIPMIVYLSDLFKQKHPSIYQKMQNALSRPYMSDDVIHMILDIAGIGVDGFDPRRSLINDAFDPLRKRIVGGKDYDLELKGEQSKR